MAAIVLCASSATLAQASSVSPPQEALPTEWKPWNGHHYRLEADGHLSCYSEDASRSACSINAPDPAKAQPLKCNDPRWGGRDRKRTGYEKAGHWCTTAYANLFAEWKSYEVLGFDVQLATAPSGEVMCKSLDGSTCLPAKAPPTSAPIDPLVCGRNYRSALKNGSDGYDQPGHWCNSDEIVMHLDSPELRSKFGMRRIRVQTPGWNKNEAARWIVRFAPATGISPSGQGLHAALRVDDDTGGSLNFNYKEQGHEALLWSDGSPRMTIANPGDGGPTGHVDLVLTRIPTKATFSARRKGDSGAPQEISTIQSVGARQGSFLDRVGKVSAGALTITLDGRGQKAGQDQQIVSLSMIRRRPPLAARTSSAGARMPPPSHAAPALGSLPIEWSEWNGRFFRLEADGHLSCYSDGSSATDCTSSFPDRRRQQTLACKDQRFKDDKGLTVSGYQVDGWCNDAYANLFAEWKSYKPLGYDVQLATTPRGDVMCRSLDGITCLPADAAITTQEIKPLVCGNIFRRRLGGTSDGYDDARHWCRSPELLKVFGHEVIGTAGPFHKAGAPIDMAARFELPPWTTSNGIAVVVQMHTFETARGAGPRIQDGVDMLTSLTLLGHSVSEPKISALFGRGGVDAMASTIEAGDGCPLDRNGRRTLALAMQGGPTPTARVLCAAGWPAYTDLASNWRAHPSTWPAGSGLQMLREGAPLGGDLRIDTMADFERARYASIHTELQQALVIRDRPPPLSP